MPGNEEIHAALHFKQELCANALKLVSEGKGILAADESIGSIKRKFDSIGIENTQHNRQQYRELLFTASSQVSSYISGCIMHEESFYQKTSKGKTFVDVLNGSGILVGIKVDKGLVPISNIQEGASIKETITEGLDGLLERCIEYYKQGARFAKWRSAFKINSSNAPSSLAIKLNTVALAQYASVCQNAGLVPIVEPDILMDGAHDLEASFMCSKNILAATIKELQDWNVILEGILIKTNFVLPGAQSSAQYADEKVAKLTLECLVQTIPPAIPGIVFLSGGLSETKATSLLNAINKERRPKCWKLSFSFGRALQNSVVNAWQGRQENSQKAAIIFQKRAKANSDATLGRYIKEEEPSCDDNSMFTSNYNY